MSPTLIYRSATVHDFWAGVKTPACWDCPAPWDDEDLHWPPGEPDRLSFYFGITPVHLPQFADEFGAALKSDGHFSHQRWYAAMACGRRYVSDRQAMFEKNSVVLCESWDVAQAAPEAPPLTLVKLLSVLENSNVLETFLTDARSSAR